MKIRRDFIANYQLSIRDEDFHLKRIINNGGTCMFSEMLSVEQIDSIRQQNREFRTLEEKHKEYEKILDELQGRSFLTPEQEFSKRVLKKKKLKVKDRMAEIIQEFCFESTTYNNVAGI